MSSQIYWSVLWQHTCVEWSLSLALEKEHPWTFQKHHMRKPETHNIQLRTAPLQCVWYAWARCKANFETLLCTVKFHVMPCINNMHRKKDTDKLVQLQNLYITRTFTYLSKMSTTVQTTGINFNNKLSCLHNTHFNNQYYVHVEPCDSTSSPYTQMTRCSHPWTAAHQSSFQFKIQLFASSCNQNMFNANSLLQGSWHWLYSVYKCELSFMQSTLHTDCTCDMTDFRLISLYKHAHSAYMYLHLHEKLLQQWWKTSGLCWTDMVHVDICHAFLSCWIMRPASIIAQSMSPLVQVATSN